MVGQTVIRGTRIPVSMILRMLGHGIPPEEILREYPRLQRVDKDGALACAPRLAEQDDVCRVSNRQIGTTDD